MKLQESRVAKEEEKNRVDKENSILKNKMKHLDV